MTLGSKQILDLLNEGGLRRERRSGDDEGFGRGGRKGGNEMGLNRRRAIVKALEVSWLPEARERVFC